MAILTGLFSFQEKKNWIYFFFIFFLNLYSIYFPFLEYLTNQPNNCQLVQCLNKYPIQYIVHWDQSHRSWSKCALPLHLILVAIISCLVMYMFQVPEWSWDQEETNIMGATSTFSTPPTQGEASWWWCHHINRISVHR